MGSGGLASAAVPAVTVLDGDLKTGGEGGGGNERGRRLSPGGRDLAIPCIPAPFFDILQAASMGGVQIGLAASATKFKQVRPGGTASGWGPLAWVGARPMQTPHTAPALQVMNGPQGRSYLLYGGGAALLLFILYLWYR